MKKPKPKQMPSSKTGPKEPPTVIQLPGGVVVRQFPFRITSVDAEGRPLTFERARGNEDSDCVLWATSEFLDQKLPAHLDKRFRDRIERSIPGATAYETKSRDIQHVLACEHGTDGCAGHGEKHACPVSP